MARRRELKGLCNDLRDTFISRYNRIDGYWALGVFQAHLTQIPHETIKFSLVATPRLQVDEKFQETAAYYRRALMRIAMSKKIPMEWISAGEVIVESRLAERLACTVQLTSDCGRLYASNSLISVRSHDPRKELRSGGAQGPTNQQGR